MYLASVNAKSKVGKRIAEHRQATKDTAKTKDSELGLEAERMRLMNSEDAEERKRGEEMVTPGSIMAAEGDESAFAAPTEMEGQQLGDIPANSEYEATNSDADVLGDAADEAAEFPEGIIGGSVLDKDTDALTDEGSGMDVGGEEDGKAVAAAAGSQQKTTGPKSAKRKAVKKIYVWMPMVFPTVPPKGEFDVQRLRASKYFFH